MSTDELLARFKPQLRYDSQEAFFADSAEQMVANPGNELRREDGEVLASAGNGLALDLLGFPRYSNGAEARKTDVLGVHSTDYRNQYARLRVARPDLKNRVYAHAAKDGDGHTWLQYWLWYFYNDYHLACDIGLHEGDWEMVQLRLAGDQPDLALYAQHAYAEERAWQDVEKTHDGRPVVYPGRGSHASYFEPGLFETEGWYDIADGKRAAPEPTLEIVHDSEPPWVLWPGLWGDTKAQIAGLEDPSPTGPARHGQWRDPSLLRRKTCTRKPAKPRPAPELGVRMTRGVLELAYDFTRHAGGEPVKLIATVNSPDEKGVPPRSFTFDVEGRSRGSFATNYKMTAQKHYDIYSSVTMRNEQGQLVPTEPQLALLGPGLESKIPSWVKKPIWWIEQLFQRR